MLRQTQVDLANAEGELRTKRAQIKRLQGEAMQAMRQSPRYPIAMRVLTRWRERCAPSAKELEGKRLENCLARLRRYSEDDLDTAVEGYARFPFVVNKQRSPMGTPAQWFADAELIFRSGGHVNTGMRLAQDQVAQIPPFLLEQIPWQRVRQLNRAVIVRFLTWHFGAAPMQLDGNEYLSSACPRCCSKESLEMPLRIFRADSTWATHVAECWRCGYTEAQLLGLIKEKRPSARAELQLELVGA